MPRRERNDVREGPGFMRPECDTKLQVLLDKQEIHEALMRYCRGIDRRDKELIDSAFHADALDDHGTHTYRGSECGEKYVATTLTSCKASVHAISNEFVEVRGDVAFSESYFLSSLVIEKEGKEHIRLFSGRYVDRFERRDGAWRIAHRIVIHEWDRLDPIVEYHFPRPLNLGQGLRSREDVSYRLAATVKGS